MESETFSVFWVDRDLPECLLVYVRHLAGKSDGILERITSIMEWCDPYIDITAITHVTDLDARGQAAALALLGMSAPRDKRSHVFRTLAHLAKLPADEGGKPPSPPTTSTVVLYSSLSMTCCVREDFTIADDDILTSFGKQHLVHILPVTLTGDELRVLDIVLRDRRFPTLEDVEERIAKTVELFDTSAIFLNTIKAIDVDMHARIQEMVEVLYSVTGSLKHAIKASELVRNLEGRMNIYGSYFRHCVAKCLLDDIRLSKQWRPDGLYFIGLRSKADAMLEARGPVTDADFAMFVHQRDEEGVRYMTMGSGAASAELFEPWSGPESNMAPAFAE